MKILVIDDRMEMRKLLAWILPILHHEVITSVDGEEGINVLERDSTIELVLTDLEMPRKSGLEVVRFVKEHWPGKKAILMSGADVKAEAVCFLGADAFLQKPFGVRELQEVLERVSPR